MNICYYLFFIVGENIVDEIDILIYRVCI